MVTTTTANREDHMCVRGAVCLACFKAGVARVRAKRDAWAQRALPFETAPRQLTARAVAHREQMLAHLARLAGRA